MQRSEWSEGIWGGVLRQRDQRAKREAFDDGGSRHYRGPGRQPVWLALSCRVVIGRECGME